MRVNPGICRYARRRFMPVRNFCGDKNPPHHLEKDKDFFLKSEENVAGKVDF